MLYPILFSVQFQILNGRRGSRAICKMAGLKIITLVALMISASSTIKMRKYVGRLQGKDVWPLFIYQTVAFNREPFVRDFSVSVPCFV